MCIKLFLKRTKRMSLSSFSCITMLARDTLPTKGGGVGEKVITE